MTFTIKYEYARKYKTASSDSLGRWDFVTVTQELNPGEVTVIGSTYEDSALSWDEPRLFVHKFSIVGGKVNND